MEEQAQDLGQRLARYYGPRVVTKYVDALSPEMMDYPEALRLITHRNVPLPLVTVDGKPRFAGGISLEMITGEIEKLGITPLPSTVE